MRSVRHITLPFGVRQPGLMVDVIRGFLRGVGRNPNAKFIYLAASRQEALAHRAAAVKALGPGVPATYWGTVDGFVEWLAENATAPWDGFDLYPPSRMHRLETTRAAMQAAAADGRTPSRAATDCMAEALHRVRVTWPPHEAALKLEAMELAAAGAGARAIERRIARVRGVLGRIEGRWRAEKYRDEDDFEWLLAGQGAAVLGSLGMLVVDDVYRLAPAQVGLLAAAAKHAPEVVLISRTSEAQPENLAAPVAPESPYERLLAPRERAYREIVAAAVGAGAKLTDEKVASAGGGSGALAPERAAMVATLLRCERNVPEAGGADALKLGLAALEAAGIRAFAAANPRQEARYAAREIKKLILYSGVAPSAIAVAFVTKDQEEAAAAVFHDAGIPVCPSSPPPVSGIPPVGAILSLAKCAAGGFAFEQTLAALRSPWLTRLAPMAGIGGGPSPSRDTLWQKFLEKFARLARGSNVIGGVAGQRLEEQWLAPMRETAEWLAGDPPPSARERLNLGLMEHDGEVLPAAEALIRWLDTLRAVETPRDLADWLLRLAADVKLVAALDARVREAENGATASAARRDGWDRQNREGWGAFYRVLAEWREYAGGGRAPLARLVADLCDMCDETESGPLPAGERVRFCGLLDLRGQAAEHVFVCGLHDGALPFPDAENLYLPRALLEVATVAAQATDAERAALTSDARPMDVYRHLFARALCNGPGGVWLTVPGVLSGDTETVCALPLAELLDAAGVPQKAFLASARVGGTVREVLGAADAQFAIGEVLGAPGGVKELLGAYAGKVGGSDEYAARWLPGLLAGIEVSLHRDDPFRAASPYEGRLGAAAKLVELARMGADGLPSLSPSTVESYARCPMLYFLRTAMNIPEPVRAEEDLSPASRGTFLHAVLENFYLAVRAEIVGRDEGKAGKAQEKRRGRYPFADATGLKDARLAGMPLLEIGLYEELSGRSAESLMLATLEAALAEHAVPAVAFVSWVERLRDSLASDAGGGAGPLVSELSAFLAFEREQQAAGLYAWLVEYSFGGSSDPESPPYTLMGPDGKPLLLVRGSIDRVDVLMPGEGDGAGADGADAGDANARPEIVIRDYKSGGATYRDKLIAGTAFQLPLYARAVLTAAGVERGGKLQGDAGAATFGGFFYQKLRGLRRMDSDARFITDEVKTALGAEKQKAHGDPREFSYDVVPERIAELNAALASGQMHPTLIKGSESCGYCEYRLACAVRKDKQDMLSQAGGELLRPSGAYFPEAYAPVSDADSAGS